jgi:poly-gamma-glutamate synthesis protein (capsule biosynthesis protein)
MGAIGAGPTLDDAFAAHVIESHGLRIAFLAITERVNGGPGHSPPEALIARWDEDAVVAHAVEAARARADVVVVSIHWSHDFWPDPIGQQERRAAFLVEHGADVILGSGPHILHRVSRLPSPRGEAICAYSLGNLISNQGNRYRVGRHAAPGAHPATWLPTTRDGAWLRIPVHVENGRVAIRPMTAVPLFTANNFWAMERRETRDPDIQILPLSAQPDPALVSERRAIIAQTLGPEVTLVER